MLTHKYQSSANNDDTQLLFIFNMMDYLNIKINTFIDIHHPQKGIYFISLLEALFCSAGFINLSCKVSDIIFDAVV